MKRAILLLTLVVSASASAQDPHAGESPAQKDARMKWWREARFGMFIHWGLYAEPAGTWKGRRTGGIGEWIMQNLKIPVDDYAGLAQNFNPVQFDADRWVHVAKSAGMKYIVMTAKHHEGFAMFHSADPYGISATPFKRDPIAEMALACRKAGLKFGVYYSQAQDWHHAGGAAYGGHWDPKQDGDLHRYVQTVAAPQVAELMRYKPAILWWDTPVDMSKADIDALTAPLPKTIIMNNRLGNGVPGDTETPEQTIPATGFPGRDWETCMTINDTWGYKSFDTNFKSTEKLLRNLIDIASKGGNYLLNVGPDARGVIPEPEVSRLAEIGAWLKENGRSVYGSTASPYRRLPFDGRATVKGDSLYLHVFAWPSGGLSLPGLMTPIKEARVVSTGEKLTFSQSKDGTVAVKAPREINFYVADAKPWPTPVSVELKLTGMPVVVQPETKLDFGAKGRTLIAEDAILLGGLLLEGTPSNVGYWTNVKDTVSWNVTATEEFRGEVRLEVACEAGSGGSEVSVLLDGKPTEATGKVEETGSWQTYRPLALRGGITIPKGIHTLTLVARSKPGLAVMNLRSVLLADGHY